MSTLQPPAAPRPPAISAADLSKAQAILQRIATSFSATVVGQRELLRALLVSLMAEGHVLLESLPGLAKTTAARTLAESVQASFHRIQCTPDLLPSDIVGTQVYDHANAKFETRLGPVHANFVLLDEINRSSAKTQSAMLEAMQERQTSIGGVVYALPDPFMVLATQNPIEQEGTYVLPEAQMDRFLLKEVVDYPEPAEEAEILRRAESGHFGAGATTQAAVTLDDVRFLQKATQSVYVDDAIKRYIVTLIDATRRPEAYVSEDVARYIHYGASPRGSMALQSVARALAVLGGRSHVVPEDVKALRCAVLRHRIVLNFEAIADGVEADAVIEALFAAVPTP